MKMTTAKDIATKQEGLARLKTAQMMVDLSTNQLLYSDRIKEIRSLLQKEIEYQESLLTGMFALERIR